MKTPKNKKIKLQKHINSNTYNSKNQKRKGLPYYERIKMVVLFFLVGIENDQPANRELTF